MLIQHIFDDASRIMTVISFVTFAAILAWTYGLKKEYDFAQAAGLPFADDAADDAANNAAGGDAGAGAARGETGHV